jgi:NADH dehydrogenase [ubiquinone] 1 alpha subcomplex assembly factor 7
MRPPDEFRLDEFMAAANAAFYARPDPLAAFVTAPELTQVFGEILGLWAALVWEALGAPAPVTLAEAGPGRGTLMKDALRAVAKLRPRFASSLALHFIETSPSLAARLREAFPEARIVPALEALPAAPLILVGNEFLDALPVRQFVFENGVWRERHVAAGRLVTRPLEAPPPHPHLAEPATEGDVFEWGEAREAFVAAVAARLGAQGGAALFIDYGPYRWGLGESLQAIAAGRPVDPIATPQGEADLTAHVDFAALACRATEQGLAVWGPLPQGAFLTRLGLFERTAQLAAQAPPEIAARLGDGAERLARPERMGALFKVLALTTTPAPPPGFASEERWSGSVEGDVSRLARRGDEAGAAHDEEEEERG